MATDAGGEEAGGVNEHPVVAVVDTLANSADAAHSNNPALGTDGETCDVSVNSDGGKESLNSKYLRIRNAISVELLESAPSRNRRAAQGGQWG